MKLLIKLTIILIYLVNVIGITYPPSASTSKGHSLRPLASAISTQKETAAGQGRFMGELSTPDARDRNERIKTVREMIKLLLKSWVRLEDGRLRPLKGIYAYTRQDIVEAILNFPGIRRSDLEILAESESKRVAYYAQAALDELDGLGEPLTLAEAREETLGDGVYDLAGKTSEAAYNSVLLNEVFGMANISQRQRDIVIASVADGKSHEDIGRDIGVSGSRVGQLRDKALRRLRNAANIIESGRRIISKEEIRLAAARARGIKQILRPQGAEPVSIRTEPVSFDYEPLPGDNERIAAAASRIDDAVRSIPQEYQQLTMPIFEQALTGRAFTYYSLPKDKDVVNSLKASKGPEAFKAEYARIIADVRERVIQALLGELGSFKGDTEGYSERQVLVKTTEYYMAIMVEALRRCSFLKSSLGNDAEIIYLSYLRKSGLLHSALVRRLGEDEYQRQLGLHLKKQRIFTFSVSSEGGRLETMSAPISLLTGNVRMEAIVTLGAEMLSKAASAFYFWGKSPPRTVRYYIQNGIPTTTDNGGIKASSAGLDYKVKPLSDALMHKLPRMRPYYRVNAIMKERRARREDFIRAGVSAGVYRNMVKFKLIPHHAVTLYKVSKALQVDPVLILKGRPWQDIAQGLKDGEKMRLLRLRKGWTLAEFVRALERKWLDFGPIKISSKNVLVIAWEKGQLPPPECRVIIRQVLNDDTLFSNVIEPKRRTSRGREQWVSIINMLIRRLSPGSAVTPETLADISGGEFSAEQIREAIDKYGLSDMLEKKAAAMAAGPAPSFLDQAIAIYENNNRKIREMRLEIKQLKKRQDLTHEEESRLKALRVNLRLLKDIANSVAKGIKEDMKIGSRSTYKYVYDLLAQPALSELAISRLLASGGVPFQVAMLANRILGIEPEIILSAQEGVGYLKGLIAQMRFLAGAGTVYVGIDGDDGVGKTKLTRSFRGGGKLIVIHADNGFRDKNGLIDWARIKQYVDKRRKGRTEMVVVIEARKLFFDIGDDEDAGTQQYKINIDFDIRVHMTADHKTKVSNLKKLYPQWRDGLIDDMVAMQEEEAYEEESYDLILDNGILGRLDAAATINIVEDNGGDFIALAAIYYKDKVVEFNGPMQDELLPKGTAVEPDKARRLLRGSGGRAILTAISQSA